MKAKEKRKHLEREEEKAQEQPGTANKPRNSRFLVCLQNTWARMAGCMRRRTSSQEKRSLSNLPGPSNIHPMGRTDNNRPSKEKEDEATWRKDGVKEVKETDKAKKSRKTKFLARLRKPWPRITDVKWRGTYVTNEHSSCEIPEPSPISMEDSGGRKFQKKENDEVEKYVRELIEKIIAEALSRSTTPEPGSPAEPSSGTVPLSLASFTFHRKLGQGGSGQVYLATDIIRKERVAIKVVKKRFITGHGCGFIERHVLQLTHKSPYLVHGLAAFHTVNYVYYVMEAAARGNLYEFMEKNFPLGPAIVKFITTEVVCGTEFLHGKGILHRDLKTDNILLTREGHIKITDFGLAVKVTFQMTKGECHGTSAYTTIPEMVKVQAYMRGLDFTAIGRILYELLTMELPHTGIRAEQIEKSIPLMTDVSLDPSTAHIIEELLCYDDLQRLGVQGDIKKHLYFSDINWEDVEAGRMAPPQRMSTLMAASVDLNIEESLDYAELPTEVTCDHQEIFNRFGFVCPEWSNQYHPDVIKTNSFQLHVAKRR